MKKISAKLSALAISLFPVIALAQQSSQVGQTGQNVGRLLDIFGSLVNRSIAILVALALAVFFWGLVRYLFKLGGDKGAENGKSLMVYGIVALFVMVSVWGIINFVSSFFGINTNANQNSTNLVPTDTIPRNY